jgi:membrane-associated protease RseP (regulator of RpoE activity)
MMGDGVFGSLVQEESPMRSALALCSLTFILASSAFAQNPPPGVQPGGDLDPANNPAIRKELDKVHEELSNLLKQQTETLRTITPNAGIIPLNGLQPNGMRGAGNCINGNCGPMERLYGPGRTGLVAVSLPADIRAATKIADDTGVLIKEVYPDTPAAVAGYKAGDILVEFNNSKVPNDLSAFMGSAAFVKNDVPVTGAVIRNNNRIQLGEMRLTDRRVIPAPVMVGDLTPRAIDPRDQAVDSNANTGSVAGVRLVTGVGNLRRPGNGSTATIQRFDGVKDVTNTVR